MHEACPEAPVRSPVVHTLLFKGQIVSCPVDVYEGSKLDKITCCLAAPVGRQQQVE